jgi:hypothetical protein
VSETLRLLVWHETQRVPATVYGNAHRPGNFTIDVCPTQEMMDAARRHWPDAIVYHFTDSGGGGMARR